MPRGKKKTETSNTLLENTAETSAKVSASVDVVSEQPINAAATATDKPKNNTGRKTKSASAKSKKVVAEKGTKTAASSNTSKSVKSAAAKSTKKTALNEKKNVLSDSAPIVNTAENKKRAYNKKAKSDKTEEIIIQSNSGEYSMFDITEMCKKDYRNGTRKQIKSIKVYIKAEDNGIRAYYVVNDNSSGHIDL